jgi:hypothetical protein
LRRATEAEIEKRGAEATELVAAANRRTAEWEKSERVNGATLQLALERLAEFIHSADLSHEDRQLLSKDVARLGGAADWSRNLDISRRYSQRKLAPATPGEPVEPTVGLNPWIAKSADWLPAEIPLNKIWLCDGTNADWYAAVFYQNVPEFNNALTAESPSEAQQKIRDIWRSLAGASKEWRAALRSIPVKGTFDEALDTAHEFFVQGKAHDKTFKPDDEIWLVFVAQQSFLIRQISTRTYTDQYSKATRTEYVVHVSVYIGDEDDVADRPPVTFALIPLGRQNADSVGVMFSCMSICGRKAGSNEPELVDTKLPNSAFDEYRTWLPQLTGFRVAK